MAKLTYRRQEGQLILQLGGSLENSHKSIYDVLALVSFEIIGTGAFRLQADSD